MTKTMKEVVEFCKRQLKLIEDDYDYADRTLNDVAEAYRAVLEFIGA